MYDYNNENELYNNEIKNLTDIRLETEKYKNNKYNEDEIVMNENINLEEQNNINDENYINEDLNFISDLDNILKKKKNEEVKKENYLKQLELEINHEKEKNK